MPGTFENDHGGQGGVDIDHVTIKVTGNVQTKGAGSIRIWSNDLNEGKEGSWADGEQRPTVLLGAGCTAIDECFRSIACLIMRRGIKEMVQLKFLV